jgi:Ran GTPase-activating protein (RanGAP) involved in mRNA processing and transport
MGKAAGSAGVCPRKTMNVDPYRDRCVLPDVDQSKLRRVAFCVDVEIAGAATYTEDQPEATPAPPLQGVSSLTKREHEIEAKKKKDVKQKKGEGAALKNPSAIFEEKDKEGVVKASGQRLKPEKAPEPKAPETNEVKEPTRKKEKKKRSEAERKERKERKYRKALFNGDIPVELKREGSGDSTNSSPGAETPPNPQDRPTTDPLRIYRRCCQLRETPILKRIAEQISSPSACHAATPGILSSLDLSGFWMQLPDLITLGDYLAVVPVKRLILENCSLGDEAVRVILAGLLSAKTPEQAKHNKKLCCTKVNAHSKNAIERLGVIEKLSLKDNPKIGKEGWRHIALFINMSRSLKAIDLSMIPFPQPSATVESVKHHSIPLHKDSAPSPTPQVNMSTLLQEAIGERLEGSRLEELVMAECALSTECIGKLADGVMKAGCTRLGLANNGISQKGLEHVIRYVQSGKCEGLDLGGNDLREGLNTLAEALDEKNTLWALSLADCHLSPASLESLLPALVQLPNFRFLDLSHNRDLFSCRPTVLSLIRKYLPQCPMLKRIHLKDVAMTPEHAIAIAEVLPECPNLCHLNILDNHLLSPLASAKTESDQEEACALYASLMAAVRVSHTIICIDIEVPSPESSEIVKALARQVVAYSLRNLERMPLADTSDSAKAAMADAHGGEKQLTVPDVLLHLVGHVDDYTENHDNDEPAPDDDYIVGGTGVVKALDICLNRAAEGRKKDSRDLSPFQSGTGTPVKVLQGSQVSKGKAKDMSKNLLDSARKIRARLQPALIKEAKSGNEMSYSMYLPCVNYSDIILIIALGRLQFLDSTLERMIQRFEDEYPETRLPKPIPSTVDEAYSSPLRSPYTIAPSKFVAPPRSDFLAPDAIAPDLDDEHSASRLIRPSSLPRRSSSPSLAARQAQEEGRMHRFGQRVKRDILRPETQDYAHGTTGMEVEAEYLKDLRRRLESFDGIEIKDRVELMGPEAVLDAIGATAEELAQLEESDPEEFERIKKARAAMFPEYQKSSPRTPAQEQAMRMYEGSMSTPMPMRKAVGGESGT